MKKKIKKWKKEKSENEKESYGKEMKKSKKR